MGRALLVPLCLAPAAAFFLTPAADPVRAAADDAWPARASGAFEGYVPLAEAVLRGPAAREQDGLPVLRLGGVRFVSDQPTADLTLHAVARDSIARGLRDAATERGQALVIEGELMPVKGGADFLVEHRAGELAVSYAHPGTGEVVRAARAAPDRRTLLGRSPWLALTALGSPLIGLAVLFKRPAGPDAGS